MKDINILQFDLKDDFLDMLLLSQSCARCVEVAWLEDSGFALSEVDERHLAGLTEEDILLVAVVDIALSLIEVAVADILTALVYILNVSVFTMTLEAGVLVEFGVVLLEDSLDAVGYDDLLLLAGSHISEMFVEVFVLEEFEDLAISLRATLSCEGCNRSEYSQ